MTNAVSCFQGLGRKLRTAASALPVQGDIAYRRVWGGEGRRRSETWTSLDGLPGCPRTAAAQICRGAAFPAWHWNIPGLRRQPRWQQILCKKTTTKSNLGEQLLCESWKSKQLLCSITCCQSSLSISYSLHNLQAQRQHSFWREDGKAGTEKQGESIFNYFSLLMNIVPF